MKKLILIIVAVLGMGLAAQAQNANRSGAFIEFSGGYIVGDSPIITEYYHVDTKEDIQYFSGLTVQLSGGYRWAIAKHWAVRK